MEDYPSPKQRRRVDLYWARELARTLLFALAVGIMGSVLFILLSIIIHGNVKW